MLEFAQDRTDVDYLLFAGKANYMRGMGDQLNVIIDWTNKDYFFGFFMVWTSENHCLTAEDRVSMDYGPFFPEYYGVIEKVNYLKLLELKESARAPDVLLTEVDMDDEDYDDILRGKLAVDDVGFDLEYQNWDQPPDDLTEEEIEDGGNGTGWIWEIDGDDWLRKYARGNNADW